MQRLLGLLVGLLCWVSVASADIMAPDALIKSVSDDVIAVLKQDKDIKVGDQKKIVALVDAKLLPHFNFQKMTQLAVGKAWRGATPEQRQALVTEFHNLLIRTYSKAFSSYKNQVIEVQPVRMVAADTEVTVKTVVKKPGGADLNVTYEMEKTATGWKAFDLAIEGAGLVATYRNSFGAEIDKGGIDGLIKALRDKNAAAQANK